MSEFNFISSHLKTEESAWEHRSQYCFDLDLRPGEYGGFDCATQLCKLGDSNVSITKSFSGWGYRAKSEADGILFTIPQHGIVTWDSASHRYHAKVGTTFLVDHREINASSYSSGSQYLSIYLCHSDIARYLALLIGETPSSRVNFINRNVEDWVGSFLTSLVSSIICLASNSSDSKAGVLERLKESLIFFALYNVKNNFSIDLHSSKSVEIPAPFFIKRTIDYIQTNFEKPLTLSELAILAGVSVRGLQQGFRKFKQTTPMCYLRDVRLANAKTMLVDRNSQLSAKDVAINCGFTNYYLFSKYYTSFFKERPIETLIKNRSNDPKMIEIVSSDIVRVQILK